MNLKFYFDYLGKCNQMLKELVQEKVTMFASD